MANWQIAPAVWPSAAQQLGGQVLAEVQTIDDAMTDAVGRLEAISNKVSYSSIATSASELQQQLQQLVSIGCVLAAAPGMHIRQSAVAGLSARAVLDVLATKCRDLADKRRTDTNSALVWLWSSSTAANLAATLKPLCQWFNVPELSASYRRISAAANLPNTKLTQPAVPLPAHFGEHKTMLPKPLNDWYHNTAATLAQLASLDSSKSPVARLNELASKRQQWLAELQNQHDAFNSVVTGGECWALNVEGGLGVLASTLADEPPVNSQFSVAIALLFDNSGITAGVMNVADRT